MKSFIGNNMTMNLTKTLYRVKVCMLAMAVAVSMAVAVLTTDAQAQPSSGQAFSISPPLIELKADPGKTVMAKIKLTNISDGELLIKTQLNDFGAKNETGEPNIIFDENKNTSYSLRQWIASSEPFMLKSKETKELEIPIAVPTDAEPGGHYAVIRFTGTAPELEESGVALSASIGSLVLMQVSGDIKKSAAVEEFYTANTSGEKTTFFETAPVEFIERIKNDGNVHLKPTGTIELKDMFGSSVVTMRINGNPNDPKDPPKSVLPDSIRRFDQKFKGDGAWMFGRYEATVKLQYADGRPALTDTISFWVIPYKLILMILLGAGIVGYLGYVGIRRYNAFIVRKARKNDTGGLPGKKPPKA